MNKKTQPPQRRERVSNDALHRIVTTKSAHCEVQSAPGGGKTHACIRRIVSLVESGVPARQIVVLSFSNAAVKELGLRVRQHVDALTETSASDSRHSTELSDLTIKTAHALALKLSGGGTVLTDKAAESFIRRAIVQLLKRAGRGEVWKKLPKETRDARIAQLETLRQGPMLRTVLELFGFCAAAGSKMRDVLDSGRFESLVDVRDVLLMLRKVWRELKGKEGVVDFGDMLSAARVAIRKDPAQFAFTHILVDEFQDCSPAQARFLATLASLPGRSLMVFGDPDQAIFGFAGGRYTPLSEFLGGVEVIRLPRSRRLTAETAALASAIAGHEQARAIRATRHGVKPVLITSADEVSQAYRVAQDICELLEKGVPADQIAVLGRVKALLHPVEMALLEKRVLTTRLGTKRNRKHVRRVLKLVGLVERSVESGTNVSETDVPRALKVPVGTIDAHRWSVLASDLRKVTRVASFEGQYIQAAKAYVRALGGARTAAIKQIRDDVNRWAPLCRKYRAATEMRDAVRNLERSAVRTGTIHASKGREWAHVFVVGATDGILPWHQHQPKDDLALAEERNLLYVAVTRAKDAVWLYHAPYVHSRSRKTFEEVSRFLRDDRVWPLMRKIRSRVPT